MLYLIFNEGYAATRGRRSSAGTSREASGSRAWSTSCYPAGPTRGLLALMLLHHARRAARVGANSELVLLEEQDRERWDRAMIGRALRSSIAR